MCVSQNHPINEWVSYYYNLLQPGYFFFVFTLLLVETCILDSLLFSCWIYESFCSSLTLTSASSSSLQLTLLKSIKTVLSLILTLTYLQRVVRRSNKYVHVGKEFCRLLLMHAGSGSSPLPPPPPKVFSVRPSLLSHSSTRLAGCPLQVPSKVNACYMHLKNVPFPLGPWFLNNLFIHQMATFQQNLYFSPLFSKVIIVVVGGTKGTKECSPPQFSPLVSRFSLSFESMWAVCHHRL